jgi:sigma-E factor negative regulatory protein RseA
MKDQISALIDDEISLRDAEYLYTALKAKGESRECWVTYQLIGDVMRQSPILKSDLSGRIMRQIESEPTIFAPNNELSSSAQVAKKSPMLWSVAASFAAVMFVGMIVLQQQGQQPEAMAPIQIAQSLPAEYLLAHQSIAPSSAAYYIQNAAFSESAK